MSASDLLFAAMLLSPLGTHEITPPAGAGRSCATPFTIPPSSGKSSIRRDSRSPKPEDFRKTWTSSANVGGPGRSAESDRH